jgi:hypothetical protein
MHLPINVKSPNNISKCQMEFNSAFKGLRSICAIDCAFVSSMQIHYMNIAYGIGAVTRLPDSQRISSYYNSLFICYANE